MEKQILSAASTQYTDLKGSIAVDFEGGPDNFEKFIQDLNVIDMLKYFPVGIRMYGGRGEISLCSIYCVDFKKAPIDEDKPIIVTEFKVEIPFSQLLKSLKRVDILLHSKYRNPEDYQIENVIE